ncbi:MAG: (2Fe-2S)-binding protein, partial [Bacteriovoracia bacterium]
QEALSDWNLPPLADDVLVCECYCVSALDIRQACASLGVVDIPHLRERFGLGNGCGGCINRIDAWKNLIFR